MPCPEMYWRAQHISAGISKHYRTQVGTRKVRSEGRINHAALSGGEWSAGDAGASIYKRVPCIDCSLIKDFDRAQGTGRAEEHIDALRAAGRAPH